MNAPSRLYNLDIIPGLTPLTPELDNLEPQLDNLEPTWDVF